MTVPRLFPALVSFLVFSFALPASAAVAPSTPTALGASGVGLGAATLDWGSGGNPGGTVYELERSTGAGFGLRASTTGLTFVDIPLSPASTYYYRVRALNAELVASAYTSTIAVVTPPVPVYPTMASIAVTPATATLLVGATAQFSAVGTFTDGSTRALVSGTGWQSRSPMSTARLGAPGEFESGKFFVFGGFNGASLTSTEAYDPLSDAWTARAAQPVGRSYAQAAASGGKIYVAGGCITADCASVTNALWMYDPAADAWTLKASMPTARFQLAFEAIDGKLYAAGGLVAGYSATAALEVYDPATNAWETKASMPLARGMAAAGAIGGKLLAAGGGASSVETAAELQIYDPAADSWSAGAPQPLARAEQSGATVNGKLYVVGDAGTNEATAARTFVYDAASGAWSEGPALNVGRYNAAAASDGTRLYVAGSALSNTATTSLEVLQPVPDFVWSTDAPSVATVTAAGLATALSAGAASVIASSGAITGSAALTVTIPALTVASIAPSSGAVGTSVPAAIGGSGFDGSASLSLEKGSVDEGVWTATGAFTQPRFLGAHNKLRDGRVLLTGGLVEGVALGRPEADVFDPATGAWTATAPLGQGRYEFASVMLADGRVLVAGGKGPTGAIIDSVEIYDPGISTWTTAAPMSLVRQGLELALLPDGRVLAAGGWTGSVKTNTAEIYDPAADAWTPAAPMSAGRGWPGMTVLRDGKILISGDSGSSAASTTAEVYDPAADAWTPTGSMGASRSEHATLLLPDGRVLAAGGRGASVTNTADVYDPATGLWTSAGTMAEARFTHALVWAGGAPLVIGGYNSTALSTTEIYDVALNGWRAGPALATGTRAYPRAVVLDDGTVLAAGGRQGAGGGATLNTAEVLAMPTSQIPATGVAVSDAQNLSGTFDLAGAATGYWDVVVRESGGRTGRLDGGFTAVSPPAAPTGFSGAAVSAGSILWSWTDNSSEEAGFRVSSGAVNLSGDLPAGVTTWLQTGLGANFLAGPLSVRAFNIAGTADSANATRTTLAAPPASLASSGVSPSSATVGWSAEGNPAGTTFHLERSTGTGFGLRFAGAATFYYEENLAPAATYYYRALALNGESVATAYSSTFTLITLPLPSLPGAPGTPAGTALGTSSVSWTWSLAAGATSHNLHRAATDAFLAAASSASFVETGLTPNTAYGLRAAGVNLAGAGPLSDAATTYTLAAAPSGTGVAVTSTTVTASWGLNGNPASTVALLERSTDAVVFSTLTAAAMTVYADADLLGCTTYYYRVRNVNGDGLPTDFVPFQAVTANTIPSPPSGLAASANAGGTVSLSWGLSPTEGVTGYRLYWDAGTGTVSYGAPIAVLGSTATAFTTGVLTSSSSYTFALRAAHRCGVVETTGASAMSGAAAALPAVRAAIKEPDSGRRINGNRVTIIGELITGTPADAQQVLFQYKLAASTSWLDVPAANVNHSNPDLAFPYFVHWDVSALPAGPYDLRAVAYDLSGAPDPAPPAVVVVVDPVAPDVSETLTVEGKIKKDQTVSNAVVSVVETAGAGAGDPAVRVTIPPGVVNTASATLSVIANPSITTAAPAGQTMVGSAIKIGLSNGQTALAGTAAIVMTYPDTVRFPSLLQIYYLDEATGAWSRDFTTTVDAASRTVTGNTPHFSTFVLMLGTAFSPNLDSVQVYPVPFKPNGTNPDEGKPFTHGDANSGIIFANLASASEIKIYTLTGRLVSRLDSPTIAGTVRWDARNQDGRDVASGAYFAVITAPGQKSVVKKLVVIR